MTAHAAIRQAVYRRLPDSPEVQAALDQVRELEARYALVIVRAADLLYAIRTGGDVAHYAARVQQALCGRCEGKGTVYAADNRPGCDVFEDDCRRCGGTGIRA